MGQTSSDWVTDIRESFAGAETVMNYLGRYTHRIAISNSRILQLPNPIHSLIMAAGREEQAFTCPIRQNVIQSPRHMLLFFYYPSEEYIAYLMTQNDLTLIDEIEIPDIFNGLKERERNLIFEFL